MSASIPELTPEQRMELEAVVNDEELIRFMEAYGNPIGNGIDAETPPETALERQRQVVDAFAASGFFENPAI